MGWIITVLLLALLLSGIFILWQRDFRTRPRLDDPRQAAEQYLFALTVGDTVTPQQLATADSKGVLLQHWFAISDARVIGELKVERDAAQGQARLSLTPTRAALTAPALKRAALNTYTVTLSLVRKEESWQVDQRALFRSLRWQMKTQNPGIVFPPWEGVSE